MMSPLYQVHIISIYVCSNTNTSNQILENRGYRTLASGQFHKGGSLPINTTGNATLSNERKRTLQSIRLQEHANKTKYCVDYPKYCRHSHHCHSPAAAIAPEIFCPQFHQPGNIPSLWALPGTRHRHHLSHWCFSPCQHKQVLSVVWVDYCAPSIGVKSQTRLILLVGRPPSPRSPVYLGLLPGWK